MVPTVPFSAAAETRPTSPDHVHVDDSQPISVTAAAVVSSSNTVVSGSAVASISFDDGRCADEQPKTCSNLISFSPRCEGTSQRHAMKRKSKNDKRVIEIREDQWNNDGWAWRKYGKKSIKGSPYPRNYYRCSTKKDCLARKQVERSVSNKSSFIVSYLGDHLHPQPTHLSSLANTVETTESSRSVIDLPKQPPAKSMMHDGTEMDEDIDELIKNYLVMSSYKSIF